MIFAAIIATSRADAVVAGLGQAGDVLETACSSGPRPGPAGSSSPTKFVERAAHGLGQRHRRRRCRSARSCRCSSSSTLGVIVVSMNISEPPPLRSAQARCDTGSVCSRRQLLVAQRGEHQVGRHQLGQRGRVGLRVGLALGQHLVGCSGRAGCSWRAAISGGCGACAKALRAVAAARQKARKSFHREFEQCNRSAASALALVLPGADHQVT